MENDGRLPRLETPRDPEQLSLSAAISLWLVVTILAVASALAIYWFALVRLGA
jgi:hypothetical protein